MEQAQGRGLKLGGAKSAEGAPKAPVKDLSGRYRVKEGFHIGVGPRLDETPGTVGKHPEHGPGEIVDLSHEDALSIIKLTRHQKTADGKRFGPAIETIAEYEARVKAEAEHAEQMKALFGDEDDQPPNAPSQVYDPPLPPGSPR